MGRVRLRENNNPAPATTASSAAADDQHHVAHIGDGRQHLVGGHDGDGGPGLAMGGDGRGGDQHFGGAIIVWMCPRPRCPPAPVSTVGPPSGVTRASLAGVKVESERRTAIGADDQHFASLPSPVRSPMTASSRSEGNWMARTPILRPCALKTGLAKKLAGRLALAA